MGLPRVVTVAPASPAERAGLQPGDEVVSIAGQRPRDVIEWQLLVDEAELDMELRRGGLEMAVHVPKGTGEPLGAEVHSALFDQVRTCDNHCEFCFIHQLPPGMRPSLYVKDDDYRLSFLYGNFTTLTRFTEADLERVVGEGLGPLYVSIHATDPELRSRMLRNRRGATSLRWLRALLDSGVEVHGQVVVCPGLNDGDALETTFAGILDRYPELATACVVPLGVSRHSHEPAMRPHTRAEAEAVVALVEEWQQIYLSLLGRRLAFAADEYYLLAARAFPAPAAYEGFAQHENGVGMARTFEQELLGPSPSPRPSADHARAGGFFSWVDGAPAEGYRAPRGSGAPVDGRLPAAVPVAVPEAVRPGAAAPVAVRPGASTPVAVLTGEYGARVLEPLLARLGRPDVRVVAVANDFFGGNIGVTGLLVGADLARTLARQPDGHRYLLPDVCLSKGVFLDGTSPSDLPRPVEVVPTDGRALRQALGMV